jgi:hypothetical protein
VTAPRGEELDKHGLAAIDHLVKVGVSELDDVAGSAGEGQESREDEEGEQKAGHCVLIRKISMMDHNRLTTQVVGGSLAWLSAIGQ